MTSTTLHRLPSLHLTHFAAPVEFSGAVENPCVVPTATSRYRNDPYRANVLRMPFEAAAPTVNSVSRFNCPVEPSSRPLPPTKVLRAARHLLPALPNPTAPAPLNNAPVNPRNHIIDRRANAQQQDHQYQQQQHSTLQTADIQVEPQFDASPPDRRVALIKYKRAHTSGYYLASQMPELCTGSIIIVQGDRGEHIATVVNPNLSRPKSTPTTILRIATGEDLIQHQRVREDEAIALDACRAHASRLGLDPLMEIIDVEFQLDFQKLTVFFQARTEGQFVDFRNLQRTLYQHFRCRIWIVDS